jgi:transposase
MGTRPAYPAEYRAEIVPQVGAGRTFEELACEHEPTAQTIRNWLGQADRDQGRGDDGPTSGDREELTRLRRENTRLREERAILAQAAAWFGRETGLAP